MKEFDVIVVGGGFSGVCAAISAARHGAKVLLAEKGNSLGGAAVNCLVNPFMAFYTKIDGETRRLTDGIFTEILDRLKEMNGYQAAGNLLHEEYLKLILNRMALEEGVQLLYHAYLTKAATKNQKIQSVEFATKGGILVFYASYIIDATGDADVAFAANCPTRLGRESDHLCQPMTLCFRLGNIDTKAFFKEFKQIDSHYRRLQTAGKIKNPRENVLVFPTLIKNVLHFNSTRICKKNPVDPFDLTDAEIEAREQVFELYRFLKENFEFCQNAELIMTSLDIGVRESRMIDGEYVLTGQDLISCTKFPDAVAAGNYDIDIHNPEGTGTSHYYFKPGTYYTIPYRSLLAKNVSNLLVAGRCASFDHEAQASCRIMPICASLGQAAGTAAAIACHDHVSVRELDILKLQAALKQDQAFF